MPTQEEFQMKSRLFREKMLQKGAKPEKIDAFIQKKAETFRATQAAEAGILSREQAFDSGLPIETVKNLPTSTEMKSKEEQQQKDVEAKKTLQGLFSTIDEVKTGAKETNVFNVKNPFSSAGSRFEQKKALAGQFLAKLVEEGRLSDQDRSFYLDKILNVGALGPQGPKEETLDSLKVTLANLSGFSPEEFGLGASEEDKKKIDELPTIPEVDTSGQISGRERANQAILGGLDKVGVLPALKEVEQFMRPVDELLNPKSAEIMRSKQEGKNLTPEEMQVMAMETASANFTNFGAITNKAGQTAIRSIAPKAGNMFNSLLQKVAKAKVPVRQWLSPFTIPTKLNNQLKPIETAEEMLKHNVAGSFEDMASVVDNVTGDNGLITKLARKIVTSIPDEIPLDEAVQNVKNVLADSIAVDEKTANRIIQQIRGKAPFGKGFGTMNAADAYDFARQLEKLGHQFNNSSTYLTKNLGNEQIGHAYLVAAEDIMGAINKAVRDSNLVNQIVQNDETLLAARQVSERLFKQLKSVKSLSELRSTSAPFVKLGRMIDLTEEASQSVFSKGMGSGADVAKGAVRAGVGGMIAGIPGMIAGVAGGMLDTPALRTRTAQMMTGKTPTLPNIPQGVRSLPRRVLENIGVQGARSTGNQ